MGSYDQYDALSNAIIASNAYPSNLLRSHSFKHDLMAYNEALGLQESRLFEDEPDFSGVKLFEAYDGCGKSTFEFDSLKNLGFFLLRTLIRIWTTEEIQDCGRIEKPFPDRTQRPAMSPCVSISTFEREKA